MLTLARIQDYFEGHPMATIEVLTQHFKVDKTLMRERLQHFIRKGCLRCKKISAACGGCQGCSKSCELYLWKQNVRKNTVSLD